MSEDSKLFLLMLGLCLVLFLFCLFTIPVLGKPLTLVILVAIPLSFVYLACKSKAEKVFFASSSAFLLTGIFVSNMLFFGIGLAGSFLASFFIFYDAMVI